MSIIDDLQPSTTHFNPVTGKPYPLHVANPHANIDIIHSDVNISGGGGGSAILLYDFVDVATCTPFLRTINDGTVTDTDLNGQPYTVVGEVLASCPTYTPSVPLRNVVYSHKTSAYTVAAGYKSLSVSFENDGAVNGRYAPAGYTFTHDYFDGGYAIKVMLDGTSYMVWEGK